MRPMVPNTPTPQYTYALTTSTDQIHRVNLAISLYAYDFWFRLPLHTQQRPDTNEVDTLGTGAIVRHAGAAYRNAKGLSQYLNALTQLALSDYLSPIPTLHPRTFTDERTPNDMYGLPLPQYIYPVPQDNYIHLHPSPLSLLLSPYDMNPNIDPKSTPWDKAEPLVRRQLTLSDSTLYYFSLIADWWRIPTLHASRTNAAHTPHHTNPHSPNIYVSKTSAVLEAIGSELLSHPFINTKAAHAWLSSHVDIKYSNYVKPGDTPTRTLTNYTISPTIRLTAIERSHAYNAQSFYYLQRVLEALEYHPYSTHLINHFITIFDIPTPLTPTKHNIETYLVLKYTKPLEDNSTEAQTHLAIIKEKCNALWPYTQTPEAPPHDMPTPTPTQITPFTHQPLPKQPTAKDRRLDAKITRMIQWMRILQPDQPSLTNISDQALHAKLKAELLANPAKYSHELRSIPKQV